METAGSRTAGSAVSRQPAAVVARPPPGVSTTGQGAGGAICARGAGSGARPASKWRVVPRATPDAIFGIATAYRVDQSVDKVSVVIGAYRREDGTPWVLPSVREAEHRVLNADYGHEYLPIDGHKGFCQAAATLLYGPECQAMAERRLVATQVLSGTGGLRVGMEFCKRFLSPGTLVLLPNPTWPNHMGICAHAGLEYRMYRYLHPSKPVLDMRALVEDLRAAPEGSIVMLHACAHNPTGVDPTRDEWREIASVCEERGHLPFFDVAYQGFASGDVDADAWAVRMFVERGLHVCASQSFSKNFGLYGERAGCLTFVTDSRTEAASVRSQVNSIIRAMYSNPPSYGARLVHTVLSDPVLAAQWRLDCRAMANRIHDMRLALRAKLEATGASHDWSHITSQIGMFSYTGLSDEQCERLRVDHHIYVAGNGRVSMAAVTPGNVDALARAILAVTEGAGVGVPGSEEGAPAPVAVIDVSAGAVPVSGGEEGAEAVPIVPATADGDVCGRTPVLARKPTSSDGQAHAGTSQAADGVTVTGDADSSRPVQVERPRSKL